MIRKMTFADIPEVQQIDMMCFKADCTRRTEGIKGYIEESNNTSIVYELAGKVVGYNFIHIWGSFAWFGAFGVHPDYQGKGIGKELIEHTIKILNEDFKVTDIGLYTMPESQYNVGFYMSLGFIPHKLSLSLKKDLSSLPDTKSLGKYTVTPFNIEDEGNYLILKKNIESISNEIFEGLTLCSQLHLIKNEHFGIVFLLKKADKIEGFVLCHTKAIRDAITSCLEIKLVAANKNVNYKEALDCIIHECANYAKSINYKSLSIDCSTDYSDICSYLLLKHNFKIQKTQLMMLMKNKNPMDKSKGLILTRLAG